MKSAKTKKYQKIDPISHILLRPDMYCGSTKLKTVEEYLCDVKDGEYNIFYDTVKYSPAILRIFIEALSNAIDNVERSKLTNTPCTKIKVNIDIESGRNIYME